MLSNTGFVLNLDLSVLDKNEEERFLSGPNEKTGLRYQVFRLLGALLSEWFACLSIGS